MTSYSVLELCAGGGGQAIGLESAGFVHAAAIDIDQAACSTLRLNRPDWHVIQSDISLVDFSPFRGIDLLAGGIPCPPFSVAGRQLGSSDERDLFPQALNLIEQLAPAAVLLENVPGFASAKFASYRWSILNRLQSLGYTVQWNILHAHHYGVPQLRPRFILLAFRHSNPLTFEWPLPRSTSKTVSDSIGDLMAARGWQGIDGWLQKAHKVAPTLVGGSKKHGGPDLGPTRSKQQWSDMGVDGRGLANDAPAEDFAVDGQPRLTVAMTARIQAFPDDWVFSGKKTSAYRQIGNAFPPPVAQAVGETIREVLDGTAAQHRFYLLPQQVTPI